MKKRVMRLFTLTTFELGRKRVSVMYLLQAIETNLFPKTENVP